MMGDTGHGVLPFDEILANDCSTGFEFDGDDGLSIDIDTIYKILDEDPGSAEGSQEKSSPVGLSTGSGDLEPSQLQNGTQATDWFHSRDSYSSRPPHADSALPICSYVDHQKLGLVLGSSPARTCSASLNDWFTSSQDEKMVESVMPSCSISSDPVDRYTNGCNIGVNLSMHDDATIESKFTSCWPSDMSEHGHGTGAGSHSSLPEASYRFICGKDATNGLVNSVSEFQSVSSMAKPLPNARGFDFEVEGDVLGSNTYSYDAHLADKELNQPMIYDSSSSYQNNTAVHVTENRPVSTLLAELENLVYSSVPGKDVNGAVGGDRQCWSGVPTFSVSFQTDADKDYAVMASRPSSPRYFHSNASLQYVAADQDIRTQSIDYPELWNMDGNHSKISPESFQSDLSQYRSCSDDDSDVYIIESNGSVPPQQSLVRRPAFSSENSVVSQTYNHYGRSKLQPNKEQLIFQAALQDLSQPRSEASPPEGSLTVPLLIHQRIALSWMIQKETSSFPCSGGILADDQGLGKTVSTIALILKERPTLCGASEVSSKREIFDLEGDGRESASSKLNGVSEESDQTHIEHNEGKRKGRPAVGTLVVCPTSVMRQWADELRKKVSSEASLSVLVYYGPNRTKDPCQLAKYDVVVTTYSIVSMEVPKQPLLDEDDEEKGNNLDDCGRASSTELCSKRKRKNPSSPRKKSSKQKKGVDFASLEARSGPLAKVSWFRVVLDEAQSIKNRKTQVARACWGLRAKRRWCLSGTPIQNAIDDLYSYFRFLRYDPYSSYTLFCSTIKNPISKNPMKGYQKLQAILHTIMLRRTKGTLLDGKPIISLPPKCIELRKVDFTKEEREFYSRLECDSRDQFREYAEAGTVKQNYVNILLMLLRLRQACDHPLLVKGYESNSTLKASTEMVKNLPHDNQAFLLNCLEASQAICGICNDVPDDAVVSICGHVYCKQCICEHLTGDDNHCPRSSCKLRLTTSSLFSKETLSNSLSSMKQADNASPLCSVSSPVEAVLPSDEKSPYGSSKIKAALDVLMSLAKPKSRTSGDDGSQIFSVKEGNNLDGSVKVVGEKAIVFSQWTKMLDLLEACLKSSCIEYRRLDGTMSVNARDKAVKDFNTLPEVSVMIMSLKAASLGLNMVAACHVLMLDLWWNPTTEDQAIDRAHRIGQTRPVTVVRFTVKDTVEDRILALQQKKRSMVASAFGEDEKGSRQAHLSVDDLKYLFMGD